MPKYTEEDLQLAIQDVKNGLLMRKAANKRIVPYSTLRTKLNSVPSRNEAHEWRQLLSKNQEDQLCDWLILQDKLGMALTHSQIRKLATSLLGESGVNRQLGKHWMTGFLRRNQRIKTLKGKGIDRKRINRANPAAIRWRGAGLWPINMSKPMGSKFVIHNPNDTITVQSEAPISPKTNQRSEIIPFTTPSNSRDIASLVRSHKKEMLASPTTRQLLRTISKGFDRLQFQIAQLEEKIKVQDQNSSQSKARKRGRVYKDPNRLFQDIRNVKRARRRIKTPEVEDSE
ncbi:transposase-like protein [Ilyonectria robusta]